MIGSRGGSEVVGKLVTEDSLPVIGALVVAMRTDSVDEKGKAIRFDTAAAVSSDKDGRFKFEKLDAGEYYLSAALESDSLVLPPIAFRSDSSRRLDMGTLVMKKVGAIRGTVVPAAFFPQQGIFCSIDGTSFIATVNRETGIFIISRIPPDTSYEVTVSGYGYRSVSIPGVPVRAGETTVLQDTVRLELDPAGKPEIAPQGLTVSYDTLSGTAYLIWKRVPVEDVKRYAVYHSIDSGNSWKRVTVNDTAATVQVFAGIGESEKLTLFFQVAALDNENNEGPRGEIDTLFAVPPSWLRVDVTMGKVGVGAAIESVYIAMSFTSKIRSVKKIVWWADDPDSVIRAVDIDNDTCGADTLIWVITPAVKLLYVTAVDNAGSFWTDSLDAVTLLPTDRWQISDSLLEERRYAGACVVNGKIYVFGGRREKIDNRNDFSPFGLKTAEMYDPVTRKWSKITPMNEARMKAAYAAVEGKIYVFGGTSMTVVHATVELYDPSIDRWEIIDTMQQPIFGAAACTSGGLIYLTGGVTGTKEKEIFLNTVITYDPRNRKWGTARDLGIARQFHQAVEAKGNILVIGGLAYDESVDEKIPLKSIECIPVSAGSQCSSIPAELSTTRFSFCSAVAGKKLAVIGGLVNATVDEVPVTAVEIFGLGGNFLYSGAPMPAAREGSVAVTLNGKIYVIGGSERGTGAQKSTKAVYVYYP